MKVLNITFKLPNVAVALLKRCFQSISGKAESQDHPKSPEMFDFMMKGTPKLTHLTANQRL